MKFKSILKVIIGFIAISIIFALVFFSWLFQNIDVSNEIITQVRSPDGKYTAIGFIRDAGATTGQSPQVSLLKTGQKLNNKSGNVFIGDHSNFIQLHWENNKTLVITHSVSSDYIFKQKRGNTE